MIYPQGSTWSCYIECLLDSCVAVAESGHLVHTWLYEMLIIFIDCMDGLRVSKLAGLVQISSANLRVF